VTVRVTEAAAFPEAARPLLDTDPRATFFLDPSWLGALVEAYPRFRPFHLVLEEGDRVTGVLPVAEARPLGLREFVSLPFGTHGGPLLDPGASEAGLRSLLDRYAELTGRLRTVRFEMTVFDPPAFLEASLDRVLGEHKTAETDWVLDLGSDPEAIWKGYDTRLRRSLRRATRAGVWARAVPDRRGWDTFHRLYAAQARTWPIAWTHGRSQLQSIRESLGPAAQVWLGGLGEETLCAEIVLYHEARDLHLWLSGASPESRPVAAYHHLLHTIVLDAARRGFRACHFGASMGSRDIDRFKRAFGPVARPLVRFYHQPAWVDRIQRVRWRGDEA